MTARGTVALFWAASACASPATPKPPPAAAVAPAPPVARDSLVLTAANGAEIWFTEGRAGHDAAGGTCSERSVEIRRGERRIRVPLLYTGTAPVRRGAHEIEAELWLDCRPMARYRVDLETGRPTKLGAKWRATRYLVVALALGGSRAHAAQVSIGAARWLTDPSVTDYRLSIRRYWLGPIALVPLANVAVQGPSGAGAFLIGGGGEVLLPLSNSARPYLVAGASVGFIDLKASVGVALWSGWSAGAGAELLRIHSVGIGPELRYQHLSREGTGGISLGLRLGSAIGKGRSRPLESRGPDRRPRTRDVAPPESSSPPPLATVATPRSRTAAAAADFARSAMGTPYRWGGSDQNGFDCSGLIQYAYDQIGIKLPRSSQEQAIAGSEVPRSVGELAAGDILVFAATPGDDRVSHVGLYLGDGTFIHSASGGVKIGSLRDGDPESRWWLDRWIGARRILD